jgi:hypothetical protein
VDAIAPAVSRCSRQSAAPRVRGGAVSFLDLGTSDEIRSEPVADRFGGDIGGTVFRVDFDDFVVTKRSEDVA